MKATRVRLIAIGLVLCSGWPAQAQNVSITDDGAAANANAMLDVQSPAIGDGRGLLIPRVTEAQRTAPDDYLDGGLLDGLGDLRGGPAQGLMVYQTDGSQGFYYNTSTTAAPTWVYLARQLPLRGDVLEIGDGASATAAGLAIGVQAAAQNHGTAIGHASNGYEYPNSSLLPGTSSSLAIGHGANGYAGTGGTSAGFAIGKGANAYPRDGNGIGSMAIGHYANARHNFNEDGPNCENRPEVECVDVSSMRRYSRGATAVGNYANAFIWGTALGNSANAYNQGTSLGNRAWGINYGTAVGSRANGVNYGTAIGYGANAGENNYAFAKGTYSRCQRHNEEWKSDDGHYNRHGYGQANYHGETYHGSAIEIFLGGVANKRFGVSRRSALTFSLLVTAFNASTDQASSWQLAGAVRRGRESYDDPVILGLTTVAAFTEGGLTTPPEVVVDTNYNSLALRVTGVTGNAVEWNATMSYSELRVYGYTP